MFILFGKKEHCMINSYSNAELLLEEIRLSNIKPKNKEKEIFLGYSLIKNNLIECIENYFRQKEIKNENNR